MFDESSTTDLVDLVYSSIPIRESSSFELFMQAHVSQSIVWIIMELYN